MVNLPDGYEFGEQGLFREGKQISNFLIYPTVLYQRQGEQFPFAADLEVRQGANLVSLSKVTLQALNGEWWKSPPPGCWYAPHQRRPDRDLAAIFQYCIPGTPTVEVIQAEKIGWLTLPSGRSIYVTGNSVIGLPEGEENVWSPPHLERLKFEASSGCTLEAALNYFWGLFNLIPKLTDILLVYTLSSFLSPVFREAGLISRFPIILEGPTESKKTTLACLTCGVFQRESDLRSCVASLTSTRCALEIRAKEMRHAPLIVDDLFPDGGCLQQSKALNLIRNLANQDARESMSGKAIVGNKMDCGIVITAEFFPRCERSTRTRCLRLKLRDRISNAVLHPFQEDPAQLTPVFEAFIGSVSGQYQSLVVKIATDFKNYRSRRSQADASLVPSERLAEIGFFLYETLDIFLQLFPQEQAEVILWQFQNELNVWLRWQLSSEAAPNLRADISANILRLGQHPKYGQAFQKHCGIWRIDPDILCSLLREELQDPTIERQSVINFLRDCGALLMDKSGAATKKVKGRRLLHILPERLH